jgi:hypothetical protein
MSNTVDIKDINALVSLGASFRDFRQQVLSQIAEIHSTVMKESEWIQDKVSSYQREVERSRRDVEAAKSDLYRCQHSGTRDREGHDQRPSCGAEERALALAQARLQEWTQRLQLAQRWRSQVEAAATEFKKEENRLSQLITSDMEKGLSDLGRLIAAYQAVSASAHQISPRYQGEIPTSTGFDYANVSPKLKATEGTHGALFTKAKKEFFLRSLYDPGVRDSIKGWIRQEIRRSGLRGYWRNPPGFQEGHKLPGIDRPENFRWENADMNESRGGKQHR